jgi:hypothetical protein
MFAQKILIAWSFVITLTKVLSTETVCERQALIPSSVAFFFQIIFVVFFVRIKKRRQQKKSFKKKQTILF